MGAFHLLSYTTHYQAERHTFTAMHRALPISMIMDHFGVMYPSGATAEPAVSIQSFIWAHCLVRSRALELNICTTADTQHNGHLEPPRHSSQPCSGSPAASPLALSPQSPQHSQTRQHTTHAVHEEAAAQMEEGTHVCADSHCADKQPSDGEGQGAGCDLPDCLKAPEGCVKCMLPLIDLCNHASMGRDSCRLAVRTHADGTVR